ncbi:MAG: TrmH family RNA methyltransferase [Candidatus Pacebacteria bacterium]|nr:TrmH family RNA methyltransferase [Candidatus Paceibacterota bacterium]
MILILHNIRSLYNVGSIFRTADAAGAEKIYLCGITPEPTDRFGKYRQQLTKVSLGAEKTVKWEKAVSAARIIDKLKKEGFEILAVEQDKKSIPYYQWKPAAKVTDKNKFALILGNEVEGISKSIIKKADKILEIPMHGKKESLNVSVSAGIIMFALKQQSKCQK